VWAVAVEHTEHLHQQQKQTKHAACAMGRHHLLMSHEHMRGDARTRTAHEKGRGKKKQSD
jgi:hypothetical protein